MKNIFLFILIALSSSLSFGQLLNPPLITTTGQSNLRIKPDYVILGVQISKKIRTDVPANLSGFEIFRNEDTRIRLFDFDEKDMSESIIQVNGDEYIKEVFIIIKDLDKLDKHLLDLYRLGFTNYIHIDYRITNYEMRKDSARKEAIHNAKMKAESLAKNLGQSVGKAHTIEEVDLKIFNWYSINPKGDHEEDIFVEPVSNEYFVEPGYIIINSRIKVSFDLKK